MKASNLSATGAATGLVVTLISVFPAGNSLTGADPQLSCCDPPTYATVGTGNYNPTMPSFAPYSDVEVIVENTFTETERQAIEDAFEEWEAENTGNCTHVTFHGFQFGAYPQIATVSSPKYWVEFNNTYNPAAAGETSFNSTSGSIRRASTTIYAYIRVGAPEYLPRYIRGIMKHEIGHTFPG